MSKVAKYVFIYTSMYLALTACWANCGKSPSQQSCQVHADIKRRQQYSAYKSHKIYIASMYVCAYIDTISCLFIQFDPARKNAIKKNFSIFTANTWDMLPARIKTLNHKIIVLRQVHQFYFSLTVLLRCVSVRALWARDYQSLDCVLKFSSILC